MIQQRWIRHNKISIAIILYIFLFALINLLKPAFMYNLDGSLKDFGVGYRKKTIIPIIITIFIAALPFELSGFIPAASRR